MSPWEHLAPPQRAERLHMFYSSARDIFHSARWGISQANAGPLLLVKMHFQSYNCSTSPLLHYPPLYSGVLCGNAAIEEVTWAAVLSVRLGSQCAPCFSLLASTEELCWPSGCWGKGCCYPCQSLPHQDLSVSLWKPVWWDCWGESEPLTQTVTHPAANTEPSLHSHALNEKSPMTQFHVCELREYMVR